MADGVALCTATGDQWYPTITSDGAGGAIVTWHDSRSGNVDIYAQRINASGAVQWMADGVALCTATGDQQSPTITSDGGGGAIVTWQDSRSGNDDIYAQRVNASGAVQWMADGVALCTATGDQQSPTITSDGGGGAIVTWQDSRSGNVDIYAQRINASGAVQWMADGVALCTATRDQQAPTITSDGGGGAIVTWYDFRSENWDIYAQRVTASGAVQWMADGVALCTATGNHFYPTITSDGGGGAIVTWGDFRSGSDYDIYAQRVDASGAVQWMADGAALCTATENQSSPKITSDGGGGAIVTWHDSRSWNSAIYAQRINASGAVQWTADGVALCTATGNQPTITSDGAGGAIIAWEDYRCGRLIYAQHVTASGTLVSTMLQSSSAALVGAGIRVEWELSEMDQDVRFSILRGSEPRWEYAELEGVAIEQTGRGCAFTDENCVPGTTYKYRVEVEAAGAPKRLLFESEAVTLPPLPLTLYQNHPNPFNPQTVIRFYLPEAQEIVLDVYNVAGQRVVRLAESRMEKGYHEVTWDGRSSVGTVCASGIYFSRLTTGKHSLSRKMVIMR
jgi:hypothetical protein